MTEEKKPWIRKNKKVMIDGEPMLCSKCPCCTECDKLQARIDAGDESILDFETGTRFEKTGVPCGWECVEYNEQTYTVDYTYMTITRPGWTTCSWAEKKDDCLEYYVITPQCTKYKWAILQICEESSSSSGSSSSSSSGSGSSSSSSSGSSSSSSSGSSSSGSSSSGSSSSGSSSSGSSSSSSGWEGAGCYKIMEASQWMEHVDGECIMNGADPTSAFLRGYNYRETRRYFATEEEFNVGVPASTHVSYEPVPPDDPNWYECSEGYTLMRPATIDREVKVEYLGDYQCSGSCYSFYSLDDPDWGWQGSCANPHFPYEVEEDDVQ